MFQDFILPEDKPQVLSLFTTQDFLQLFLVQQKKVPDLLDQFSDIYAKDSIYYGLAKGIIHQIDTGDAPPFYAKLYCCSCVEDAQVSKKLKTTSRRWTTCSFPKSMGLPLAHTKKEDRGSLYCDGLPKIKLFNQKGFLLLTTH
ncbi:hypothetical protein DSO57_1001784 [Entomophthora muscae]|uniref:Uncharacterized protein n=1 Tax=Entomophthora muscae TaxID=34485 RepID=A0ACC2T8N3_9FUNG|nr:hypothetical protein DSO57_1001784 [Entomophthora muscae]